MKCLPEANSKKRKMKAIASSEKITFKGENY